MRATVQIGLSSKDQIALRIMRKHPQVNVWRAVDAAEQVRRAQGALYAGMRNASLARRWPAGELRPRALQAWAVYYRSRYW